MIKRHFVHTLILVALLAAFAASPLAPLPGILAGTGSGTGSISAGNASGDRGETITVGIYLTGGSGVGAFGCDIGWDPSVLTYVSVNKGGSVPSGWTFLANPGASSVTIGGYGVPDMSGNGTIATVTFSINAGAAYGTTPISVSGATDGLSNGDGGTVTIQAGVKINSFDASPQTIAQGESATLSWNISNATSASIDNGVGSVNAGSGSKQVSPTETTTYTLTASGASGSRTSTATVTVSKVPRPVIESFTADKSTVVAGQTVTFSFKITGATSASIDNGVGNINKSGGTATAKPKVDTVYTLSAKNAGGTTTASVSVNVIKEPIISWFSASTSANNPINANEKGYLGWNVLGADTVTIDKGVGKVDSSSGSVQVSADKNTTYVLTATNGAGTSTKETTLFVTGKPRIRSFVAKPAAILNGQAANLSWSVAGAQSIELHPGFGVVFGSNGSRGVVPTETTAYTLIARNASGEVSESATVTVYNDASDLEVTLSKVAGVSRMVSAADTGTVLGSGNVGVPMELEVLVVNLGTGDALPTFIELYENGASVVREPLPALAIGASKTVKFDWTPLIAGNTPLELVVDAASENPDLDRSNNLIEGVFSAQKVSGMDLVISQVSVFRPQIAGLKNVLEISFRITNVGDKASGSFRYTAWLTKSAKAPTGKDTLVVQGDIASLQGSGDSVMVTRTVVLRRIPNKFYFQGFIDTLNQVNEASETNNSAAEPYTRNGLEIR